MARTRPTTLALRAMAATAVLVLSFVGSLVATTSEAQATWRSGEFRTGYFSGAFDNSCYSGPGYCFVLPNGLPSWVDTVGEMYSYIQGEYYSGDYRRYTGASYLVHSMLGHLQGTVSRNVTAGDWAEWLYRLNSLDSITWNQWYTSTYDTGMNSSTDVYRVDYGASGTFVLFYDGGNLVYAIHRECANPDGRFGGLPPGPPPLNYDLTPSITSVSPSSVEGGDVNIGANGRITNSGTTNTDGVQWQMTRFRLNPGTSPTAANVPKAGLSSSAPNTYYTRAGVTYEVGKVDAGSGSGIIPRAGITPSGSWFAREYPAGTKICFALSVQPYRNGQTQWRHSDPRCATISKKPKVQVLGGDLFVGRGASSVSAVTTNLTVKTGLRYGSWAEYAIVPTGLITNGASLGMASGSAYANGINRAKDTDTLCRSSYLSFNNVNSGTNCSPGAVGRYKFDSNTPNIASRFTSSTQLSTTQVNISTIASNKYQNDATGGARIQVTAPGGVGPSKWVVINAPGRDIEINSNIIYANGPFSSANQIPQVIIIARSIIIKDSVTQVDAWLIADQINTCGTGANGSLDGTQRLTTLMCSNKLRVNGPVVTDTLRLRRTAGAGTGTSTGDPAEVFNLRPDAYLWALNYTQNAKRAQTVDTKELPPRF